MREQMKWNENIEKIDIKVLQLQCSVASLESLMILFVISQEEFKWYHV